VFYRSLDALEGDVKAAHSRKRQGDLLILGPLSLILLLGMWATGLIFGFGSFFGLLEK
jgi:hypothetical protein